MIAIGLRALELPTARTAFGIANGVGDILVASGLAVRYLKQSVPYLALEERALWRKI